MQHEGRFGQKSTVGTALGWGCPLEVRCGALQASCCLLFGFFVPRLLVMQHVGGFFFLQYNGSCWPSSAVDLFCFGVACSDGVVPFLPGRPQGSSHGLIPGLLLGTSCP